MTTSRGARASALASLVRRCGQIAAVAAHRSARVGWRAAANRLHPEGGDRDGGAFPHEFRLALEDLGPTFVKLGQLLSTRSDLTPLRVQEELSKLRDQAPSIPPAVLEAELGQSLHPHSGSASGSDSAPASASDSAPASAAASGSGSASASASGGPFATLQLAPVACGSIAQVHTATLPDGHRVAVKVRRPGVLDDINADVRVLRSLARLVARLSSRARAYDPVAIIDEFAGLLRAETDFVTEAANVEAVRRALAASDAVTIPRVFDDMSSESVLVMDWVEGIPLSDRERLDASGADTAVLARTILQSYGVMIFQADRFHADPHPGNLIAMTGDRLGVVDFGEVGSVEPDERAAVLRMVTAVLAQDGQDLADAVLAVSRTTRRVDRTEFGAQLGLLLDAATGRRLQDVKLGETLGRLLHLLRQNGIVLSSDLAVLMKTLIECESTTDELDPGMSMLDLVGGLGGGGIIPGQSDPTSKGRGQ